MGFEQFVGNRALVDALQGMGRRDRLPHALLFSGPEGIGKYTLAQMLAKTIHCPEREWDFCGQCANCEKIAQADDRRAAVEQAEQERAKITKRPREVPLIIQHHPDVVVLAPNGPLRLFQIEQARYLKQALEFVPAGAGKKVFILPEAERMDAAAANSLLKSLEEPPPHALLVLTTASDAALLPTISSRCVPMWLTPLREGEVVDFLERREAGGAAEESRDAGRDREEWKWRAAIAEQCPGAALRLDLPRYLKTRDSLLMMLAAGADRRNLSDLFSQAQKLAGGEEGLEKLVRVLYSIFQDILHIEANANGEPLRNADRPNSLVQVAQTIGIGGVFQAMTALENLERNLRRNPPARLSLEALALSLPPPRRMS